ncbi:chemotaxis protein CheW [Paenibacillus sp. CMAA1364]
MLSEYKDVFLEELEEQLQLMDEVILQLEQDGESEIVIQALFRAAHTLKGSSAAMGYEEMKRLTHEMEHLLDQVRMKVRKVTGFMIDLLFQAIDGLKELQKDIMRDDHTMTDISRVILELQAFASSTKEETPQSIDELSNPELTMDTMLKVKEAEDDGLKIYWVHVQISTECDIRGARFYVIHSNLSTSGDVLFCTPNIDGIEELEHIPLEFQFLYTGSYSSLELQHFVSEFTDVTSVRVEPVTTDTAESVDCIIETKEITKTDDTSFKDKSKAQTIRVSVERLDHLMNLVGELVIDHTRIDQVERTQRVQFTNDSLEELSQISDHLTRIIDDLQESVMQARMLPIEQLFNRFPRMIRDLTRDLGKDIDLVLEGKDTELDRTLIEEIADPLIHLIRNAVDHGIELPNQRQQAGKDRKGTLLIQATHEDNQVIIQVADDGAGIDPARMRKSAVSKGIITADEAATLTDREAVHLIFRPGFSTASMVSDISGRGVGMDIVRSHIEKLNGLIDIETELGQGTKFKIRLPLTLAIIIGLLVKLNEQTFIIPMSNISEIVRVPNAEIQTIRGQQVIWSREQIIPVVLLHDRFNIARTQDNKEYVQLVIVGSAEKRIALVVDELLGNQEIVIKSLGSYIGKINGIAGSTILGNGKVALILDVSRLMNES